MKNEIKNLHLKMLLLEDSLRDTELILARLADAGFRIDSKHAKNREEFENALVGADFDIILSDFRLPGFDAFEALRISAEVCPDIPFICLSGSIGEETAIELLKLGAVDYVLKDRPDRLPFAIKRALEEQQVKNQKTAAENLLIESEAKFRDIFHKNAIIKLILDPATGQITEANETARAFYGFNQEELGTVMLSQINVSFTRDELLKNIQKAIEKKRYYYEAQHRKAGGEVVDVAIYASRLLISQKELLHLIVYDISDRKKAETQLRLLSRAIEQSSVSIIITDPKGIIEYVNPFFNKITGYSSEEVLGKDPRILNSGYHSKEFFAEMWKKIRAGSEWSAEFRNKKKNGELYWEQTHISPIYDAKGQLSHFLAIKEDVSDKKRMLEELLIAKNKAEESDRLKTAFINNISHEIRTPLNGILGFGQFLAETGIRSDERLEMLKYVQRSSDRLMNTMSNYLDMARIVSGTMEVQQNKFLLQPVLDEIQAKAESMCEVKNLEFGIELPEDIDGLILDSDKELFLKVIFILLENAVKFTDEGKITLGIIQKNEWIQFFIRDTGIGIEKSKHDFIFEMFSQEEYVNNRLYDGSGLGLSIAKGLVDLLGGSISVESVKNQGSVFTFTIPSSTMSFSLISNGQKDVEFRSKENPVVLIAEDEESNYLYMEVLMQKAGLKYLQAVNGAEAVEICKDHPELALVLMDIKMPVMSGVEAARQIRELRPGLPIIATTAYSQTGDKEKLLRSGFDDYISKPIRQESLKLLLAKFI